jgi:hypothetical protein
MVRRIFALSAAALLCGSAPIAAEPPVLTVHGLGNARTERAAVEQAFDMAQRICDMLYAGSVPNLMACDVISEKLEPNDPFSMYIAAMQCSCFL